MKVAPSDWTSSLTAGPHVVGGDDGAEPPRGGDRLQAGDAGAHHQHAGGGDRAGRGHHHRKELAEAARGHQHRLVAGGRRLRRKGVHRLGARDARHQLQAEGGDALRLASAVTMSPWVAGCRKLISTAPFLRSVDLGASTAPAP